LLCRLSYPGRRRKPYHPSTLVGAAAHAAWRHRGGSVSGVDLTAPGGEGRVHTYRHSVRYFECDQQGVVFNMWYLGYFDEALSAYLAGGGVSYRELLDEGFDVQLVHSEIDWVAPLRWGDEAVVTVRLLRAGTTSFTLGFEVSAGAGAVATGRTVYVTIRTDGSGKVPIPAALAAAIGAGPTG
jgi:acyl-CoA thioester hydrolase